MAMILVLTEDERKALQAVLKDFYSKAPDRQTKRIIEKLSNVKRTYTNGKEL